MTLVRTLVTLNFNGYPCPLPLPLHLPLSSDFPLANKSDMTTPSTPTRSATAEMLLVSPMAPGGSPLSASRKRKVTPSREALSAKRIAIFTTPSAVSSTQNSVSQSAVVKPLALGGPSPTQQFHVGKSPVFPLVEKQQIMAHSSRYDITSL